MKTAIVKAALFTPLGRGRWGLPLLAWGEPGVAKTAVIEELGARYGLPVEVLSPGERGEGAFGVVPVPCASSLEIERVREEFARSVSNPVELARAVDAMVRLLPVTLHYPRPDWVDRIDAGGLVFVDEATTAPPALQPPIMGIVLARRIGGHSFGPRVRVMAAANPPELAAGGFDLAAALGNRLGHIEWGKPSIEEHVAYMLRGDLDAAPKAEFDAEAEEARVEKLWPEAFARIRGLEAAFLQARPGLKNQCPAPGDPKAQRGWPSDRSWEAATRARASSDVHNLSVTDREEFVAAFIGAGAAGEFSAFEDEQDLANPADVLDGKEKFKHSSTRLDRTAALLAGCAALVTATGSAKRDERTEAFWGLIGSLLAEHADEDVLVPACGALVAARLHTAKGATKVLATIQPLLKAAGVKPGSEF
jgi:hypothetical protein